MDTHELAQFFKALGDENRLKIINILSEGERCACRLLEALNISQPTLSHHMKILCETGLVDHRKDGKWMYYSLNQAKANEANHIMMIINEKVEKIQIKSECDC